MNEVDTKSGQLDTPDNRTTDETAFENEAAHELDDEMSALFQAFDDVCASDALKAQTLDRIADEEKDDTRRTATPRPRARFHAIRIAAIAACLVLALAGGMAYATPTSTVQLSQGDTVIELGVNRFGLVVSAGSNDESGRAIVAEGGLLSQPYDDALARVANALGEPSADKPFKAEVSSNDDAQRKQIEGKNQEFMAERNRGHDSALTPNEGAPGGSQGEWQSGGEPGAQQPEGSPDAQQPEGSPGAQQPDGSSSERQPEGKQPPADESENMVEPGQSGQPGSAVEPERSNQPGEYQAGADQPDGARTEDARTNPDQAQGDNPGGTSDPGDNRPSENAGPNGPGPQNAGGSTAPERPENEAPGKSSQPDDGRRQKNESR